MAQAPLQLVYSDFQAEIGRFLGYGSDSAEWTDQQTADVDAIIHAGLRQFYAPPVIAGMPSGFRWSFLRPTMDIDTEADEGDYDMPADFGRLDGPITFEADSGYATRIEIVGEARIRHLRQFQSSTGLPRYAAVYPNVSEGDEAQTFTLMLWPTPDAVYTVTARYVSAPGALSDDNPYPLGGMEHSETIKESCLAIAEMRMDDEAGIHNAQFQRCLQASVALDIQASTPDFFGYNGDRSDYSPTGRRASVYTVTVNGE